MKASNSVSALAAFLPACWLSWQALGCSAAPSVPPAPATTQLTAPAGSDGREAEAAAGEKGDDEAAGDEAPSLEVLDAPAPPAEPQTPFDVEIAAAEAALARDEFEIAADHFTRAQSLASDSPAPRLGQLRVRWAKLRIPVAYAEAPNNESLAQLLLQLDALSREFPGYAPVWRERGRLLLVLGEAAAASTSLERALSLDAKDAETHSALGVAYLATGQTQRALERLEVAARSKPEDPERLSNLGTAYMLRGRLTEAVAAYERSLALRPDDARTHGDLGAAYLADDRADRALPHLLRATALAPKRATFLTNLGYAYQRQGQLEKAVETQRQAISIDAKLGSAWINLGNALAELGRFPEARTALERAQALDPTDPRPKASLQDLAELEARPTKGRPNLPPPPQ